MTRSHNGEDETSRTSIALSAAEAKAERRYKEDLASLRRTIANLREQILLLDSEANALSNQLNQIVGSTSWRITTPFRVLARRIPGVSRLTRRFLGPFFRWVYAATRRNEPIIVRSSGALRRMEQTLGDGLGGALLGGTPTDAETLAVPQADLVRAFADIQEKFGRNVFLIAADAPPMPDKHAGGLRLYNLVRMICEMDWRVVFASQSTADQFIPLAGSDDDRERYERLLYDAGIDEIVYGSEGCGTLVRVLGADLRWAFLSFPHVAKALIPQVRLHAPWANIIYDMVDFHALRMSRQAQLTADAVLQTEADHVRLVELANAKIADVTIAVSEDERQALLDMDPSLVIEVIPPVFALPPDIQRSPERRGGLLFVGGFWHTPNVDAVLWFVQDIWPLIRRQRPDMIFRIVGSNAPEEITALNGLTGIEVLGYVPDLTSLFAQSRMSVAPLRYGAGVKGKVGESMAYGVPVVATSIGAEGMALENGKHLLVADTPHAFATVVLQLAADDDLWRTLQANGRRFVEEYQSIDSIRDKLKALVNG